MVVVTATSAGERAGCLVGFATQCSIHPPRYAVWISRKNHTFPVADAAEVLAVHFLGRDQLELAELFGGATGDEVDKFAHCRWEAGPGGVPLLRDCARRFVGRVLERFPTEDHVGFLLQPTRVESGAAWVGQLGFQVARRIDPGHEA